MSMVGCRSAQSVAAEQVRQAGARAPMSLGGRPAAPELVLPQYSVQSSSG